MNKQKIHCPFCRKEYSVSIEITNCQPHPQISKALFHSRLCCVHCSQEMTILISRETMQAGAVDESRIIKLNNYASFGRLIEEIIHDMEQEVNLNGSLKTMLELKNMREIRDSISRRRMETLSSHQGLIPDFMLRENEQI